MGQKISIGRIVEFFNNKNGNGLILPNGMESAPAIVVQVFSPHINLNVFTADPGGEPVKQVWSVRHKDDVKGEGESYWDWPNRVD